MATRRIVIAGSTGYLGRHVLDAFADAGWHVRALARNPASLGAHRERCEQVVQGDVTRPSTLEGLCDGADVVFSSVGIRTFGRKPSYLDVDLAGNMNLVEEARRAGVPHFVFISAVNADALRQVVGVAEARERIVDALKESQDTMAWTVLRPSGFFNDMSDYFEMAQRGTAWVVGEGLRRLNPIHGADLAAEAVASIDDPTRRNVAVALGGPDTFNNREIAELAFDVIGKPSRLRALPIWLVRASAAVIRPFNGNAGSLVRAIAAFGEMDFVGQTCGTHHLRAFFEELAAKQE